MKQLWVVCGWTGLQKSELAIALAKKLNAVAVNADPLQSYHDLCIGVNKVTLKTPFYDANEFLSITENINAHDYAHLLWKKINWYWDQSCPVIIVLGNPFYLQAILSYHQNKSNVNQASKRSLAFEAFYQNYSNQWLHSLLSIYDNSAAKDIHVHNRRRILRALQTNIIDGRNWHAMNYILFNTLPYKLHLIYRNCTRNEIYKFFLSNRLNAMLADDLWFNEVDSLVKKYCLNSWDFNHFTALKASGYALIYQFLYQNDTLSLTKDQLLKKLLHLHWLLVKKQKVYFSRLLMNNNFYNLPQFQININLEISKLINFIKNS